MWYLLDIMCIPCAPGFFKNATGFGLCTPCPSGYFASHSQASTCSPCGGGPMANIICPSGSPNPLHFNNSLLEDSGYSPQLMEPIRSDLETMFYLMSWPVMLYVAGAVLCLMMGILMLGTFVREHPNWVLIESVLLRLNFFGSHGHSSTAQERKALNVQEDEGEEKEEPEPEDDDDASHEWNEHNREERKEKNKEGVPMVAWMGFMLTVFVVVTMFLFIAFSAFYLNYIFNKPTIVFQTVPVNKQDVEFIDSPIIDLTIILFGYNGPCMRTFNDTSEFIVKLDDELLSHEVWKTAEEGDSCKIVASIEQHTTSAGSVLSLRIQEGTLFITPPFVQAIGYNLTAHYKGEEGEEWRERRTPGVPAEEDEGESFCRGIITASPNFILRGDTFIHVAMNYRPVYACERTDERPSSPEFWDPSNLIKDEELSCEHTRASTKLFSVATTFRSQIPSHGYWDTSTSTPNNLNFSFNIQFQNGLMMSSVSVLTATSYGEVITTTIIAVIGIYELSHVFYNPLALGITWILHRWRQWRLSSSSSSSSSQHESWLARRWRVWKKYLRQSLDIWRNEEGDVLLDGADENTEEEASQ